MLKCTHATVAAPLQQAVPGCVRQPTVPTLLLQRQPAPKTTPHTRAFQQVCTPQVDPVCCAKRLHTPAHYKTGQPALKRGHCCCCCCCYCCCCCKKHVCNPYEHKHLEVEVGVLQAAVGQAELEGDGVLGHNGEEEQQQQQPLPVLLGPVQDPPVARCRRPALGVLEPDGVALADCGLRGAMVNRTKRC